MPCSNHSAAAQQAQERDMVSSHYVDVKIKAQKSISTKVMVDELRR